MRRIAPWAAVLGLAATSFAAPIRVGIFKGTGQNRYWHTSTHTGSAAIAAMLENPATAGLQNPVIPSQGFVVRMYGVDVDCAASSCTPNADQRAAFIAALDTIDVAVLISNIEIGNIIGFGGTPSPRQRLMEFWRSKGLVSIHATTDNAGTWATWDSAHGARFQNHPSGDRNATVRLENSTNERTLLNLGMPDTARFFEEWFSFTTSGFTIRGYPYLQVHVTVDENSYDGGLGGARAMGDHPFSWSRVFPEGGRFFYTAIGHRAATFDSVYFFRRQLYNAILWAGGYDITTGIRDAAPASRFSDMVRASLRGKTLHVNVLTDGPHTVEIRGLNGSMATTKRGTGRREYVFANLRPGVHVVAVTTPAGRSSRLMTVP